MSVSYEITKDPQLLREYYQLREHCYQQELRLTSFDGSEELADQNGHILVARNNEGCLGGARIVKNTESLLSDQSLPDLMLMLDLTPGSCCVWERLALSQPMRCQRRQPEFCDQLIATSRALGYDYALMVSSVKNARFYRICHSRLNVKFQICDQLVWNPTGTFSHLEHVLSVAHLRTSDVSSTQPVFSGAFPAHPRRVPPQSVYGVAA